MGIQFRCFECEHAFNVKDFQGGKKAKCPTCSTLLRVPLETTDYAIRVETTGSASRSKPAPAATNPAPAITKPSPTATNPASQTHPTPGAPLSDPASLPRSAASEPNAEEDALVDAPRQAATEPVASSQHSPLQNNIAPESDLANVPANAASADAGNAAETTPPTAVEAAWHVNIPGSGQFGPADEQTLAGWIREGRVFADCLVWTHPWTEWQPASLALPQYFQAATAQATPPPVVPSPVPTGGAEMATPNVVSAPAPLSPVEVRRIAKRQKRKRNYRIALAILLVVAIVLVTVLAIVLTQQS